MRNISRASRNLPRVKAERSSMRNIPIASRNQPNLFTPVFFVPVLEVV
jgi:hypothetical protein